MAKLNPCPFCGSEGTALSNDYVHWFVACVNRSCHICDVRTHTFDDLEQAIKAWNTRYERTCNKVPGKMIYGERRPKCSECGYGLGDDRWNYCPKCGAKAVTPNE